MLIPDIFFLFTYLGDFVRGGFDIILLMKIKTRQTVMYSPRLKKLSASFFEQNSFLFFLFICSVYILAYFFNREFILIDEVYYNSLNERLAVDRIEEILSFQEKWAWLNYFMLPIMILFQIFLVTLCLNIGTILLDYKIQFKQLFRIVTNATIVFAVARLFIILGTWAFFEVSTFEDFNKGVIFSLSLLSIIGQEGMELWLIYPLTALNLFEVFFCLILAAGLNYSLDKKYVESLGFVIATYGLGLLTWMIFVIFLQLNLS